MAIQVALTARNARRTLFTGPLFSDPAWEIMLQLYAAALEDRHCSLDALLDPQWTMRSLLELLDQLRVEGLVTMVSATSPPQFRLTLSGLSKMECFFSSPTDLSHC